MPIYRFTIERFTGGNLQSGLQRVAEEQFDPRPAKSVDPSIVAVDPVALEFDKNSPRFTWGVGPYLAHRLFNPDLPFSMELGIEARVSYLLTTGLKVFRSTTQINFNQLN